MRGGIKTIADWEISGGNLVPKELAENRALTCSKCVLNKPGDLTSYFTVPAANLIRLQLERRNQMSIQTTLDDQLGVCDGCACPLKLKVHCPIDIIRRNMADDVKAALDPGCWVLHEP